MLFSVLTKNLKWKILTKNLVTFKRWDRGKDFSIMGVPWKSRFLEGEGRFTENQYRGFPKRARAGGEVGVSRTKKGSGVYEGGWGVRGGVDTPMHTMKSFKA